MLTLWTNFAEAFFANPRHGHNKQYPKKASLSQLTTYQVPADNKEITNNNKLKSNETVFLHTLGHVDGNDANHYPRFM